MERLISSIDDILKGENKMDFAIFSKTEMEEMFQAMLEHMPENMKELSIKFIKFAVSRYTFSAGKNVMFSVKNQNLRWNNGIK